MLYSILSPNLQNGGIADMKLSQMNTDQMADVLVRIADPAANIMHDKNALDMLDKIRKSEETSVVPFIAENIGMVARVLLKDHKMDVFEIVAALASKTVADVQNQLWTVTIADLKDSFDQELVDFFNSSK